MSVLYHIKTKYVDAKVRLVFSRYESNHTISMNGVSEEGEPLFTATVCLKGVFPAKNCICLKQWGENEGLIRALEEAGVIELTGRFMEVNPFSDIVMEGKLLVPEEHYMLEGIRTTSEKPHVPTQWQHSKDI